MRLIGIVLIVLGVVGLVAGGISYTRQRETVSVGPVSVAVRKRETIPIPPLLGGLALIAGIGLLVAQRRRGA